MKQARSRLSGRRYRRPILGVLAGWQYYWTATPLSYLGPLLRAIREAARHFRCHVLLACGMGPAATFNSPFCPAWPEPSSDSDFVPVGPWNTDGLIVLNPLHSTERARYLQTVMATGHPVVFVASGQPGPTVVADNARGILEAMRHLVEHGHRHIAFIAGSPDDMDGDTGARLKAYRDALRLYHLPADERLIAFGRHVYEGGYAAVRQLLAGGAPFSAVLASNDESAIGAMQALREAGRRIPQDVAIIGFDDRPEAVAQQPTLSSVHVPLFEIGFRAVEMLVQLIEGRPAPSEPVRIPVRLVPRESCGCGGNADIAAAFGEIGGLWQDSAVLQRQVAEAMAAAVLAEAQELSSTVVKEGCHRLVTALVAAARQGNRQEFWQALDAVLEPNTIGQKSSTAHGDDPHLWQAALSVLRERLPELIEPAAAAVAADWLDAARVTVSAAMRRRHRRHILNERLMRERLSLLTTRLLAALNEEQAYAILAQHLPEIGVRIAAVALLEAEGDDPVAWSSLRRLVPPAENITPHHSFPLRFRSREFPPPGLLADGTDDHAEQEPFSLALVPLRVVGNQIGYMVFDTAVLELYGAIVQQLAAALNTAQLYREATEGRRLAEEANRLKTRFLSMVSHELRTPLSLIVGLSDILLREQKQTETPLPEPFRSDVERILAHAQHLGRLINDVLDLASSEAGQLRLSQEAVDLSEVLRMVAKTGRRLATEKGLDWHESLPETGPWVWGDRTRLCQVALNLVHNAVKFTTRGEVRLELKADSEAVTVEVHDTGLGIPPAEQALIFDEFGRSERSIQHGYGGLGLGLAVCRRLVALHGGTIGVRSTGKEGEGSTFYFTLPTIPPPAQTEATACRSQAQKGVLLLTAAPETTHPLAEQLRQRGIPVDVMAPASGWLEKVAALGPGAVVADAGLAAGQGWQMMTALRHHPATREIPLLLYVQVGEGAAVLELQHLIKPFGYDDLKRTLDRCLALPSQAPTATSDVHTILVVDDDADTVEMHARLVQTHLPHSRVLKARGGREALEMLRRERVDLVLLDLLMPDVDGFAVLAAMREMPSTRHVPVVVLTGQVLTEADMARLNRGVATVLRKGLFTLDETVAHIQAALERKRKVSDEAQRLVRKAMAYMHEHYPEPISRQDIARHVGMDEDYLTTCFRHELGITPIAYLNRYRVNQAKRLLLETDKSITEIALEVGFSDSGYFSRVFRRETGRSPESFRRAGRERREADIP